MIDLERDETLSSGWLINSIIELIEEQTIDIDSIEELDEEIASVAGELASCWSYNEKAIIKKQNEILRAVKHLNKEIQSIKK